MSIQVTNMKKWTTDNIDRALHSLIRRSDRLYLEQFMQFFMAAALNPQPNPIDAWNIFKEFDTKFKGFITREQFYSIGGKHKRKLIRMLNNEADYAKIRDEL